MQKLCCLNSGLLKLLTNTHRMMNLTLYVCKTSISTCRIFQFAPVLWLRSSGAFRSHTLFGVFQLRVLCNWKYQASGQKDCFSELRNILNGWHIYSEYLSRRLNSTKPTEASSFKQCLIPCDCCDD